MRNVKTGLFIYLISMFLCIGPALADDTAKDENNAEDNVYTLGEVVVTGERPAVNLATTITESSAEDIVATGASTVAEALDQMPGVDVGNGAKGYYVAIRGFDQTDTKVLIDGVPAHESYFGTLDLSMLTTEAISKITVTKGASSVLYGANTMGGVINIVTKKAGKDPVTEFSTSFGNDGTTEYIVNHGRSVGDFNYWITYGYRTSDGIRLSDDFDPSDPNVGIGSDYNEDGDVRDLSDYIKRSINAKVGYDPNEDTSMSLSFDYHNNERGVPTFASRYWYFIKWDQWQVNLAGEHKFNDVFSAKARLFYVKHDDGLEDVSWDADHTTGRKWFEKSAYDDYSQGAELQGAVNLGNLSIIRLGVNYLKDNNKQQDYYDANTASVLWWGDSVGYQPKQEYEADTYTFAIEDEIKPVENLSIVLGMSYDQFKPVKAYDQPVPDTISAVDPQLGLVFDIAGNTSLHASVGKKTRFPHLKELYSEMAGGNPDLDPQKTIAYEVGASHKFNNMFNGSVAYFYNDVSDLIDTAEDANGDSYYYNVNKAIIKGIEADLDLRFTDNFLAKFNYTYMSTEDDTNKGREMEGKPKHKLNLDLRYTASFGLASSIQASYTGGEYWEDYDYNWTELPSFTIFNLRLSQDLGKILLKNSEFFLQVNNITDKYYYETSGPEAGRNFMAGLTVKF